MLFLALLVIALIRRGSFHSFELSPKTKKNIRSVIASDRSKPKPRAEGVVGSNLGFEFLGGVSRRVFIPPRLSEIASSGFALLAMKGRVVSLRGHDSVFYGRGNLEFRTSEKTPFEAFPQNIKKNVKAIALIRRSGQTPFELSPKTFKDKTRKAIASSAEIRCLLATTK